MTIDCDNTMTDDNNNKIVLKCELYELNCIERRSDGCYVVRVILDEWLFCLWNFSVNRLRLNFRTSLIGISCHWVAALLCTLYDVRPCVVVLSSSRLSVGVIPKILKGGLVGWY